MIFTTPLSSSPRSCLAGESDKVCTCGLAIIARVDARRAMRLFPIYRDTFVKPPALPKVADLHQVMAVWGAKAR
jgi:hypothetical protein